MSDESPLWASWLVAGMALICCAGPLLVAAVGAGTIVNPAPLARPAARHLSLLFRAGAVLAVLAAFFSTVLGAR